MLVLPLKSFVRLTGNEDLFDRYFFGLAAYNYLVSQTGSKNWYAVSCMEDTNAVHLIDFSAFDADAPHAFVSVFHDGSQWVFHLQAGR